MRNLRRDGTKADVLIVVVGWAEANILASFMFFFCEFGVFSRGKRLTPFVRVFDAGSLRAYYPCHV